MKTLVISEDPIPTVAQASASQPGFKARLVGVLSCLAVLASHPGSAGAQGVPAFTTDTTYAYIGLSMARTVGWSFTANVDLQVVKLGVFDSQANGLFLSHDVGLWNLSGDLLASSTVPAGTVASLDNYFRFTPLATPALLAAGQTYVIGTTCMGSGDSDLLLRRSDAANLVFAPYLSFVEGRTTSVSTDLTFPGLSEDRDISIILNANFMAVPEPSPWLFFVLAGLVALAAQHRWRNM